MKRLLILVLLLLTSQSVLLGQSNSAYLEFIGQGSFLTANYELGIDEWIGLRGGIGLNGLDRKDGLNFPISVNFNFGTTHKFEVTAGFVYRDKSIFGDKEFDTIGSIGYRYQPVEGI